MAGKNLIIFDDCRGELGPMTDLRAVFEVRTGALTTAGRIVAAFPGRLAAYWAPEHLVELVRSRAGQAVNELPAVSEMLLVNGRWWMPDASIKLDLNHALVDRETGAVVVAHLRSPDAEALLSTGELPESVARSDAPDGALLRYPWQVIGNLQQTIPHDILHVRMLEAKVPDSTLTIVGPNPIEIHETARLYPNVVLDAEAGPIVVDERATVRAGAVLCGPCWVGPGSTIIERAHIKANTAIGPACKVGGEVGGTIFQGYANKTHDGHLGDSWVGKWVNLGAGTINSNLLNTYSEVLMRLDPSGPMHRTGLTFLGSIIGDHVKTAINTRLMTGTMLGTGAMIACTAAPPKNVGPFAWLTDQAERTYRLDKFLTVMRTVMARREKTPSEVYEALVRSVFELGAN